MKKEERSKLMRLLDFITSKGFRDSVKNIFITFLVIGIVVIAYFYFVNYSAKKMKESTGIDVFREIAEGRSGANGNTLNQAELGLLKVNTDSYVINDNLKIKFNFTTTEQTYAFVKLSGNGKVINQTSQGMASQHEFVFDMNEEDYGSLFVYTVVVADESGIKQKSIDKITMPLKKETPAKITIS